MSRGGYRHGKKHHAPVQVKPTTRYIEDRVATLERQVAILSTLCRGLLEFAEEDALLSRAELDRKIKMLEHDA